MNTTRHALLAWACHTTLTLAAMAAGRLWLPPAPPWGARDYAPQILEMPKCLQPLLQWDAHWYVSLAANGYDRNHAVIFPLYPAVIRALHTFTGLPLPVAGLLVANVAGLACFLLLAKLANLYLPARQARQAVWALALFPTSYYLNSLYTEPLFMALSLACALAAYRGKLPAAGLLAAGATLTRNTGIGLELLILWAAWPQWQSARTFQARAWLLGSLSLAPAALAGFMAFEYIRFGDALAFVHNQDYWQRHFTLPWQGAIETVRLLAHRGWPLDKETLFHWTNLAVFAYAGMGLALLSRKALVDRRWLPLLALGLFWLLIPLVSTNDADPLFCISRYAMVNFPLMLAASALSGRWFWPVAGLGGVGFVICSAFFSQGWWIA